ncbi:hypothetical protein [uncultured Oscillibacter sp.]|nr:hypothetical protein [uncultured Oscillibacter sp.]
MPLKSVVKRQRYAALLAAYRCFARFAFVRSLLESECLREKAEGIC